MVNSEIKSHAIGVMVRFLNCKCIHSLKISSIPFTVDDLIFPENLLEMEHPGTYLKTKIISTKPAANEALQIVDTSK